MTVSTNQSRASAGQNLVGRDLTQNSTHIHLPEISDKFSLHSALKKWIEQLELARLADDTIEFEVANFAFYKRKRIADDGVNGLEAKLRRGGRERRLQDAVDQKLSFEMILTEWSLFASAQEIFAHLLAKIHNNFNLLKEAVPGDTAPFVLDQLISSRILEPIVEECGQVQQFEVNLNVALGMLYWLADQCFIRWHE